MTLMKDTGSTLRRHSRVAASSLKPSEPFCSLSLSLSRSRLSLSLSGPMRLACGAALARYHDGIWLSSCSKLRVCHSQLQSFCVRLERPSPVKPRPASQEPLLRPHLQLWQGRSKQKPGHSCCTTRLREQKSSLRLNRGYFYRLASRASMPQLLLRASLAHLLS